MGFGKKIRKKDVQTMRKLLISLALAVCVLLALPQAQALQTYSGPCSHGLTWELDD